MNIFEKIQKAKGKILKANLKKSGENKFAGYKYYELSDLLPTIVQVCEELKLFTKIYFTEELAVLEIINIEKPEEKINSKTGNNSCCKAEKIGKTKLFNKHRRKKNHNSLKTVINGSKGDDFGKLAYPKIKGINRSGNH